MGVWYTFNCPNCAYSVVSSGGYDTGLTAVVNSFICQDCQTVVDVMIGEYGDEYLVDELSAEQEKKFYCCPDCKGKNIEPWDTRKCPCPKCCHAMDLDLHSGFLWD